MPTIPIRALLSLPEPVSKEAAQTMKNVAAPWRNKRHRYDATPQAALTFQSDTVQIWNSFVGR